MPAMGNLADKELALNTIKVCMLLSFSMLR